MSSSSYRDADVEGEGDDWFDRLTIDRDEPVGMKSLFEDDEAFGAILRDSDFG